MKSLHRKLVKDAAFEAQFSSQLGTPYSTFLIEEQSRATLLLSVAGQGLDSIEPRYSINLKPESWLLLPPTASLPQRRLHWET